MNSLIEAYQGMFAGTRIATVGFAMETAGLGCPKLLGAWTSWSGLPAGWSRIPGRRSRIATVVHGALEGEAREETLTMPNLSISNRTPLYAVVILAVSLGIVVSALALLALLFLF
jgi:hypothetical protein